MPDAVKCNCRHPECTTCNPPDPDPTAATELARCVAWLRARAKRYEQKARAAWDAGVIGMSAQRDTQAAMLRDAADDLAAGEQP